MMPLDVRKVVLASANPGKLRELESLLAPLGMALVPQSELGVQSVPETGTTFVENALIKARHAARESGLPALADDSGLLVPALDGAPGVRSARYAGDNASDADNVARLLEAMRELRGPRRAARYHCTVALMRHAGDPAPVICEGAWSGTIAESPRGTGGFGYDPVFLDPELGKTAAELGPEAKHRRSHRGKALAALVKRLEVLADG